MTDLSLRSYRELAEAERRESFRAAMAAKGYYAFYTFVEDFRETLRRYGDEDAEAVGELLRKARSDFPEPERFSPSWSGLWEEFTGIYDAKNETLAEIPASERAGEWQVLIDNPLLPQQVVCYPRLEFGDAVFMFAYFQKDLKPNEFLRLQKVTHRLVKTGRKEASMLP